MTVSPEIGGARSRPAPRDVKGGEAGPLANGLAATNFIKSFRLRRQEQQF
jgi:hypothetical protein